MTRISVADVEARSGIEKRPGETLSEYLRRVGGQTDLPAADVEAVVTECQRRQFAGETDAASDAPIEAFLEAADAVGGDDTSAEADEDGAGEPVENGTPGTASTADEAAASGSAATGTGEAATETDSTDAEDAGGLAFYRSVAVVGVVILLAAALLGSGLLLATDLGPTADDDPETPAETDDLEEAGGDADGSGDGDETETDDDASEPNETATTETGDDSADDDEPAETPTDEGGDSDGNDTADDGDDEPSEPIGFGEGDDAENETDPDAPVGENDTDAGGAGNGTDGTNGTDGADSGDGADDEGSGFGSDETTADDETGTDDETGADSESEDADPEVVDAAPEATGTLEVTDRAAPGDHPADEYVELTNVGDAPLDMSGWTIRDREGGAVDTHGIDPLAFPEGFVLEPGASVRLVTGSGENTSETIYWDHVRQNWRDAGDVVVVADADGEEVLRHPYGDQA